MQITRRILVRARLPLIMVLVVILVSALQMAARPAESAASAIPRAGSGRRLALRSVPPMPLISRGAPAYSSADGAGVGRADDADYASTWLPAATRASLAYDLAAIPAASRGRVVVAWYAETGVYDYAVVG